MDTKLLLDIFHVPSQSTQEDLMRNFVCEHLDKLAVPYEVDDYGNVYNLSDPRNPILNAHMDTVQDSVDGSLQKYAKIRGNILSGYGVIGGDDKCGLFIALETIKTHEVNFIFSVEEEIGGRGITYLLADKDISEFPYALTLDRQGNSDIICYSNDYGTVDFENTLENIGSKFGYKSAMGLFSDADTISDQISCANLSVGYYKPHTKHEFVNIHQLGNALDFTRTIVEEVDEKFEAPKKSKMYSGYKNYGAYWEDDIPVMSRGARVYSFPSKQQKDTDEVLDAFFEDLEEVDDLSPTCCVTGKRSSEVFYLESLSKFVSQEGARELLIDLETCGALNSLLAEEELF